MHAVAVVAALAGFAVAASRWLRVAQREHYLPGSATRFALRWWLGTIGPNRVLLVAIVLGAVLSPVTPMPVVAGAAAAAVGPFGLGLRGTAPGPMRWTRRLRTLTAVVAVLVVAVLGAGALVGAAVPVAALLVLLAPLVIDAALAVTAPIEDALGSKFVAAASARLEQVKPTVVAITGSYGKTTTKGYVAHLLAGSRAVVPSPASFNNRAGLARAINEHLVPGTDVFVAEMGTYGPGEIAALCAWVKPRISVITAIGPVHLERFGTEDRIVEAKSEIANGAEIVVLNVDDPRLAALAERLESGVDVRRARASDLDGLAEPPAGAPATNVACAVAVARALGVPDDEIARRLADLPTAPNRLAVTTLSTGALALDDTYNSNPTGAAAALERLSALASAAGGKRVVVTPGMVELGPRQFEANRSFGEAIARTATHLLVVGQTNRRPLSIGVADAGDTGVRVLVVPDRSKAIAWVREHTGPGDVVLYENDLPDHYP